MLTATLKPKKCGNPSCRVRFKPVRPFQAACGIECSIIVGKIKTEKKASADKAAEKRSDRAKLEAMKGLPQLHDDVRREFNKWVRMRDAALPCISCGAPPPNREVLHAGRDAGHYRSVGTAPHLRYDESNVNAQCVHCNQYGAGNHVGYRIGLIAKVGLAEVERLESDNSVKKWTKDGLRDLCWKYRRMAKALKEKAE